KIFLLIVGNVLNIVLSLIFFYLIRITFIIELVGYYGAILAFFTTFSLINDLGIQLAYLKYFGESKNPEEEAIYNGTFLTFRTFQLIIYTVIMLIFLPFAPTYNGEVLFVYIFFIAMLFFRIDFFDQVFLSKKEVFKILITSLSLILLKNLLLIFLVSFFEPNLWFLLYIILISNISYFFLSLFLIRKRKFKKPTREYFKKFLRYSLPFFLTNSLIFIVSNIDVLFINAWSNINNVANYFTAKQFFYYFLIITNSVSNILITTFSKNIKNGEERVNIETVSFTHRMLNFIIIPMVFFTYLWAPTFFVLIFGEGYRLTGQILFIFALMLIPLSLDIVNVVQLQALGEVRFIAKFSVLENVLSIILMYFLISPYFFNLDIFGGALAYLISKIITQIIYRPIIYKKFNLGFYWGTFRNLLIMLGVFILQYWINNTFYYRLYIIPFFILIDIGLYILISYLFKGFTKEDFKFILSVINIKNIYISFTSELKGTNEIESLQKGLFGVKKILKNLYNRLYNKFPLKFDYNSELERAITGCKSILDVGCGSDSPIKQFSKKLYCVGVDMYEPWLDKAKKLKIHNEYYKMNVLKIDEKFEENSFDCVIALDLIEHLTKKEGIVLLEKMKKIAKKRVIIFTPNEFVSQRVIDDNPWEIHKSGWNVKEMKQRGYNVIGINGYKAILGEYGQIKYRPRFFWFIISKISQLFVRNYPKKAFQLLCIKEIA
ncbi:MAG: oligosaccharide flippase family protein, partial [Promethearchaeota archaeon]